MTTKVPIQAIAKADLVMIQGPPCFHFPNLFIQLREVILALLPGTL
jgi:hypothetical protein